MDRLFTVVAATSVTVWAESITILLLGGGIQLQSQVVGWLKLPVAILVITAYMVTGKFSGGADSPQAVFVAVTSTFPLPAAPQSTITVPVPSPEAKVPPVIFQL